MVGVRIPIIQKATLCHTVNPGLHDKNLWKNVYANSVRHEFWPNLKAFSHIRNIGSG